MYQRLVTEGITGLQAHLLQSASGHIPQPVLRQARTGWTDEDWAGAADALCDRGLLTAGPDPALTPAGRAVLDSVEASTDERAWSGGLAALGAGGGRIRDAARHHPGRPVRRHLGGR